MKKSVFGKTEHIHFIGIGGSGMSGIAEILLNMGFKISGSDITESETVKRLKKLGAEISIGHSPENIKNPDVVVYSSAVKMDNPEIKRAKELKIPVISRAEMLAELMRLKRGIAVAGTHGKTTTSSLIGNIFYTAGLKPTTIIGGKVFNFGTNAVLGKGEYLICEADESDGSFLKLSPEIVIVTNIDDDHLDHYKTIKNLKNAFIEFIEKIPFYGFAVLCYDNPLLKQIIPDINKRVITYGANQKAKWFFSNVEPQNGFTEFKVWHKEEYISTFKIPLKGIHNVYNSLAAIITALECGISVKKIKKGLAGFSGVERRLELKGDINGIKVYDDYGHHPTEIKATLSSINKGRGRLFVIFQPHRYTRTKILYKKFGPVFVNADFVYITEIYPASEKPIKGVTGRLIYNSVKKSGKKNVFFFKNKIEAAEDVIKKVNSGDIILTLGAGDIKTLATYIVSKLK